MNGEEGSKIEKVRKMINEVSNNNSSSQYDIVFENGYYFINEKSQENIQNSSLDNFSPNGQDSNLKDNNIIFESNSYSITPQFSLKSKFISWYRIVAPEHHKKWFDNDLEFRIEEVDSKYYASFYRHLFEIDLDNVKKEIIKIQLDIKKRRAVRDKVFENYVRMTRGIGKEIVFYYIDFLSRGLYDDFRG